MGSIRGRVINEQGAPLKDIRITIASLSLSALTTTEGAYVIDGVAPGAYTVVASGGGYLPQDRVVTVAANEPAAVDFIMGILRTDVEVTTRLEEYRTREADVGMKAPAAVLDTPASIQVVSNTLLEDRNANDAKEIYRHISGITDSNYTAAIVRGFEQREILFNGVRGNPYGSFHGSMDESGFSTSQSRMTNIERVEVLKGPASVLYGSNEPGGVVNFVTKKPKETPDSRGSFSFGEYGLVGGSMEVTGSVASSNGLFYRLAGYLEHKDSFRNNAKSRNLHVASAFTWKPSERWSFTPEYEYIDQDLPGSRLRGIPVDSDGRFLTDISWTATEPTDFTNLLGRVFQTRADYRGDNELLIDATFRLVDYLRYENYHEPRGVAGRVMRREFRDQVRGNDDWTLDANISKPLALGGAGIHRLLAGAVYISQEWLFRFATARQSNLGGPVPDLDLFTPVYGRTRGSDYGLTAANFTQQNVDSGTVGIYLQDQIVLGENWRLVVGGRYDRYDDEGAIAGEGFNATHRALTGRGGIVFKLTPALSLYGNVSNGFVRPDPIVQTASANGPFDPSKSIAFEVGAKTELLGRRLLLTGSAYQVRKTNILRPDPALGPLGTNPSAVLATGAARNRGIEIDMTGSITRAWNVVANYAFLDSEITRDDNLQAAVGKPLPNAARHSAGFFTQYILSTGSRIGLSSQFVGDRTHVYAGIAAPRYSVWDLFYAHHLNERAEIKIRMDNVFDKRYATSSLFAARAGNFPGQPRTLSVTLALTSLLERR